MQEAQTINFSSKAEFEEQLECCLTLGTARLQLIDPDFSEWRMDAAEVTTTLRRFLLSAHHNRIELIAHTPLHLQLRCPRFLELSTDFAHAVECRVTPKNLRHLTDSFLIADSLHVVRRFHSAFMRGEASYHLPEAAAVSTKRFIAIWQESVIGLHGTTLGL